MRCTPPSRETSRAFVGASRVAAAPACGRCQTLRLQLRTCVRQCDALSELRSTIEQPGAERLPELPDARIEEDFAELQRACELLEVERLRRLAEIDRRRLYERDGYLSPAS